MNLGEHHLCLCVADIAASIAFYEKLDFEILDDHRDDKWIVLSHGTFVLALFEGHIDRNLMNFRGGDVEQIGAELKSRGVELTKDPHLEPDGSWSAEVRDPDGNVIYFNTWPSEREEFVGRGWLYINGATQRSDR